jgi:general stress protein YciG
MDRAKQREIASKGGKAAHQKGTAHEWTSEEARDAGRKGGIASHRRRREQQGGSSEAGESNDGRVVAMDRGMSRGDMSSGMGRSDMDSSRGSERDVPSEPMSEPEE